jgi:hypothetical protein
VVFERAASEPAFEVPGFEALDVRDYGANRRKCTRAGRGLTFSGLPDGPGSLRSATPGGS